jgi:hypothetical protein
MGATRFFQVSAVSSVGEGNRSAEISAFTISSPTAPAAPTTFSTSIQNGNAVLSWTPPSSDGGSEVTSFRIYKGNASDGSDSVLLAEVHDGNATSYIDPTYVSGLNAYYRIYAVNPNGQSAVATAAIEGSTQKAVPESPMVPIIIGGVVIAAIVLVLFFMVRSRKRSTGGRQGQVGSPAQTFDHAIRYCPNCGSQTQGSEFCGKCGRRQS